MKFGERHKVGWCNKAPMSGLRRIYSYYLAATLCAACSPLDIVLHGADLLGQGIVNMASKSSSSSSPSTTYCRKQGSTQVYANYEGSCKADDPEIKSWEYQKLDAENRAADAAAQRAEAAKAASAPIYCLTAVSQTAYTATSGKCQADERSISKEQYDEARSKAAADAVKQPGSL